MLSFAVILQLSACSDAGKLMSRPVLSLSASDMFLAQKVDSATLGLDVLQLQGLTVNLVHK